MPRVRVLIPTYNRAHCVPGAIDSALAQTFRDLEVIVVDDGSTDATESVVRQVAARDRRVRYVGVAHGGVAAARNAGTQAPGEFEYLALLDSDDIWLPLHLENSIALLDDEPEVGLVFARGRLIDFTGGWTEQELARKEERWRKPLSCADRLSTKSASILNVDRCFRALLRSEFCPATSTVVMRMAAVASALHWNPAFVPLEDFELYLRLVARGVLFGFFDAIHYELRFSGDNLTRARDLSSPVTLRHQLAVLRYGKSKIAFCRTSEDRRSVDSEIAETAYVVGQCFAEVLNLAAARGAYLESIRHRLSPQALKGLAACFLPPLVYHRARAFKVSVREWRHRSRTVEPAA